MKKCLFFILILCCVSCDKDSQLETEIAKIDGSFKLDRFDALFYKATPNDIPALKADYPFLFSKNTPDSVWVKRNTDTLQKELLLEVQKAYPDFKTEKEQLEDFFRHLKYYDKTFKTPRVITLTNDVDYRTKSIVTDSILLIALDNYLGKEHRFYQDISLYLAANMKASQIMPNIASNYAENYVYPSQRKTFLDEMIYFGKLLYFKDMLLPSTPDEDKIGYTKQQLEWSEINESEIWSYFIENEVLYDTDEKLLNRFITEAPFSKFYLDIDAESPGRLGQYIGWQIVKAYAKNSDEDFMQILQKDPEELFRKSKFKPRK